MLKVFTFSLVALVFVSCNSSGDRKLTEQDPSYPATYATPPEQGVDSSANAAVVLNPAHGALGHRCDIAVGQPLNGSAVIPSTTNSTPTPSISLPQLPVQPADKTVRLNPAHGAPGHDCSIAVGQPLKS